MLTWQTSKILLSIDSRNYLVIKMKLVCHGHYEITIKDNMLVVEMHGHFEDDVAQQYIQDMYQVCEQLKNQIWGSLVTYNGSALFSPKAEEALIGEEDATPAFPTLEDIVTVEVRPSATTDIQVEVFVGLT